LTSGRAHSAPVGWAVATAAARRVVAGRPAAAVSIRPARRVTRRVAGRPAALVAGRRGGTLPVRRLPTRPWPARRRARPWPLGVTRRASRALRGGRSAGIGMASIRRGAAVTAAVRGRAVGVRRTRRNLGRRLAGRARCRRHRGRRLSRLVGPVLSRRRPRRNGFFGFVVFRIFRCHITNLLMKRGAPATAFMPLQCGPARVRTISAAIIVTIMG
jgi:hypothetical protein